MIFRPPDCSRNHLANVLDQLLRGFVQADHRSQRIILPLVNIQRTSMLHTWGCRSHAPGSGRQASPPRPRPARTASAAAGKISRERWLIALNVDVDIGLDLPSHFPHSIVPLAQSVDVITAGMPRSRQTAATSSASVATTTGSISPLAWAARHTQSTMGRPAISRNTLRLSRVEPSRAGITAAMRNVLMQPSLQQQARWITCRPGGNPQSPLIDRGPSAPRKW